MTVATFDTLAFTKRLRAAGIPEEQAEAQAEAIAAAIDTSLPSKQDLEITKPELSAEIKMVRNELVIVRWFLGIIAAGVFSLIFKTFFS